MEEEPTSEPRENRDPITGRMGGASARHGIRHDRRSCGGCGHWRGHRGPVGGVSGAVVGGVVGAFGGRSVAEAVNPTEEEQYWRENHPRQPYAGPDFGYKYYAPAYRTGYEGLTKYPGKKYEEIEDDLALDYEKNAIGSPLPWDRAQPAAKAAWDKLSGVTAPRDRTRGIRSGL
jgi:hypothetical protein